MKKRKNIVGYRRRWVAAILCVLLLISGSVGALADTLPTVPASPPVDNTSDPLSPEPVTDPTDPAPTSGSFTPEEKTGFFAKLDSIAEVLHQIKEVFVNPGYGLQLLQNGVNSLIIKDLENMLPAIASNITSALWGNSFITTLLSFFKWLTTLLIVCGILARMLRLMDAVRHGEPVDYGDIVLDLLKSMGMAMFALPVIRFLDELMNNTVQSIIQMFVPASPNIADVLLARPGEMWGNSLLCISLIIVTVIMLFRTFKRACTIFLQVILGYLYAYDIVKGSSMIGEWGKDVLAGYITFGVQLMFFQVGVNLMTEGLRTSTAVFSGSTLIGLILLAGVSVVPSVLRKFGQTTPPGGLGRALGQVVSMGATVARFMV